MHGQLAQTADQIWNIMREGQSGNWGMDIHQWDWVPGVGVIAMEEYGAAAERADVFAYLESWVSRNREKAPKPMTVNGLAPYAIFPRLYRRSGKSAYLDEAVRTASWLVKEAPRTREGAFEHTVTENVRFPEQVWADTIFMGVLFLARTAALIGSAELADEAQRQALIHLQLLGDKESGVLFHGWNSIAGDHMSAARWTRANGWIAAGIPMILQETAGLVTVPEELAERYVRLMDGLLRFQREDGLWSTVMDRPEFYREVSGSAGIGFGLLKAMEGGWLRQDVRYQAAAERVREAVLRQVGTEGIIGGVSGGTPVMESIEAYRDIPVYPTLYGQGLALMLLAQRMKGGAAHE